MIGSLELYGDMFAELNRLQQSLEQTFRPGGGTSSIRAMPRRTFPLVNVGSTQDAIEVLALAPGIDPVELQITIDKGVLVIAGERKDEPPQGKNTAVYAQERFKGSFRRVMSLPEDADPMKIDATYRDGLLRVTVGRRESSRPRQITVS
ncbi:MAG: heat shock protein Hsp20 [Polaromonas sp.]|nr:heat shock protein Hsp20 [Polaromonas sp.]